MQVKETGRYRTRFARPALLLVLMALLAYTYGIPRGPHGTAGLANADTRIALTRAMVDDHTLAIDRYAAPLTDRSYFRGHYYSDKAPGISLLAVPAYALSRLALPPALVSAGSFYLVEYLVTALTISLPAALFLALLWRFLLPLLGRRRAAVLTLGYGFGTMAWALSSVLFSHVITAMALFGAFMLLYPVSVGRARFAPWRWAMAGGLCGLAVMCEYPAALVGACLALFAAHAAWRGGSRRLTVAMALFAAAGLAALLPLGAYNVAVYGSPFSQGYAHLGGQRTFIEGMGHGIEGVGLPSLSALWGITFSPYRGLFILSPFLLLLAPGLAAMWRQRRQRPAALLCAASTAAMLLFNGGYYFWDGGVSLGPRQSSPALLFMVFPVAFAMRRVRWRRLAAPLIALSIAIVALCCITVLIFLPGVPDPIVQIALPALLHGPVPNSWPMLLGLYGQASRLPLVAGEALLGIMLWRSLLTPSRAGSYTRQWTRQQARRARIV